MRKNYFAKLIKYMKNVYHIDCYIQKLSDGGEYPKVITNLCKSIIIGSTSLCCPTVLQSKVIL